MFMARRVSLDSAEMVFNCNCKSASQPSARVGRLEFGENRPRSLKLDGVSLELDGRSVDFRYEDFR